MHVVIRHGDMAPHLEPNVGIGWHSCFLLKRFRVRVIDWDGRMFQMIIAELNGMYATPASSAEVG
jgi:hypothetical protein